MELSGSLPRTAWKGRPIGRVGARGEPEYPFAHHRLFYMESSGRLICQLHFVEKPHLLPVWLLDRALCGPDGASGFALALAALGLFVAPIDGASEDWAVSRVDVAVDLRFDSLSSGRLLLSALHASRLGGGAYAEMVGDRSEPTVYVRSRSRQVVSRAYSRHREEEGAERFRVVRLERQLRFQGGDRPPRTWLTDTVVRSIWADHYLGLVPSSGVVKVDSVQAVGARLADLVEDEQITAVQAAKVLAYLVWEQIGRAEVMHPRRVTDVRRLVREVGVSLEGDGRDQMDFDLGQLLQQASDDATWYGTPN